MIILRLTKGISVYWLKEGNTHRDVPVSLFNETNKDIGEEHYVHHLNKCHALEKSSDGAENVVYDLISYTTTAHKFLWEKNMYVHWYKHT